MESCHVSASTPPRREPLPERVAALSAPLFYPLKPPKSRTYYLRTLDERRNLFEWYFKAVALPATVIASLSSWGVANLRLPDAALPAFLGVVFIAGLCLLITYAKESSNASAYTDALIRIRANVKKTHGELDDVLVVDALCKAAEERALLPGSITAWRVLR